METKGTEVVDMKTGEISQRTLNAEQVDLLKRTIAIDHTDDELKLFLAFCQSKNLDPFSREVYSIKRKGKLTFQIGIDGLRGKAEETGEYDGTETFWCDDAGLWVDIWVNPEPPFAAKVLAYRKGCAKPFVGVAKWSEYIPTEDWMWKKMPSLMIGKVAEALALRKAFPSKLGGLYAMEEMAQADKPAPSIKMPQEKKPLDDEFRKAPSLEEQHKIAMEMQAPMATEVVEDEVSQARIDLAKRTQAEKMTPEQIHGALRPPESKFYAQLKKSVREKGIPDAKMKSSIKLLFNVDSSKDLSDAQTVQLIRLVEQGGIK